MHPFKTTGINALRKLGLGVAGTIGSHKGNLPSFVTPGQQAFFSYYSGDGTAGKPKVTPEGEHWRLVPQAYYYYGPFGLYGEYAVSSQRLVRTDGNDRAFAEINNQAWEIAAAYLLTGEEKSFGAVVPRHPLSFTQQGWGAWELAARVSQLNIGSEAFPSFANPATAASKATSWGLALNWYLNKNVKLDFNYEQTTFEGGKNSLLNHKVEKVFFTRLLLVF